MSRKISWLVALIGYFGPPVWTYATIEQDRQRQLAAHGWVCGTPMIGIILLACLSSIALLFLATRLGVFAHRGTSKKPRFIEFGFLLGPLLFGIGFILFSIFG